MVLREHSKKNVSPSEEAILTTILYSDIFDFSPTKEELWNYLISPQKISRYEFENSLNKMSKTHLASQNGYYCLLGRTSVVRKRITNKKIYRRKVQLAVRIGQKIAMVPSVLFVGISGAVAVENVTEDDDIDLFIITKSNTLFVTRFIISCMLEILHLRRKRNVLDAPNKICVNLLIDENDLYWNEEMQNLYTAREIAQMVPIVEKNNIYGTFLQKNQWITTFLPNIFEHKKNIIAKKTVNSIVCSALTLFELVLRYLQLSYMKTHKTSEIITIHRLAFHPSDYKTFVLDQLRLKMRLFGLLTIY